MANAETFIYRFTEKQVRTLIDAVAVQERFFKMTMRPEELNYLRKLRVALEVKQLKSSHARPVFDASERETHLREE